MILCKLSNACEKRGGGQDLRSLSLSPLSLSCQSAVSFGSPASGSRHSQLAGKPVPVSHYHHREEFLANIQSKSALCQLEAVPPCSVTPSPLNLSLFLVLSSFSRTSSIGSNLSRGYHANKLEWHSPEMAAAGWGNGHSIFLITFIIIIILLSALHTSSLVRARGSPELLWHSPSYLNWGHEGVFLENLIPNVPPESFWKCFFSASDKRQSPALTSSAVTLWLWWIVVILKDEQTKTFNLKYSCRSNTSSKMTLAELQIYRMIKKDKSLSKQLWKLWLCSLGLQIAQERR